MINDYWCPNDYRNFQALKLINAVNSPSTCDLFGALPHHGIIEDITWYVIFGIILHFFKFSYEHFFQRALSSEYIVASLATIEGTTTLRMVTKRQDDEWLNVFWLMGSWWRTYTQDQLILLLAPISRLARDVLGPPQEGEKCMRQTVNLCSRPWRWLPMSWMVNDATLLIYTTFLSCPKDNFICCLRSSRTSSLVTNYPSLTHKRAKKSSEIRYSWFCWLLRKWVLHSPLRVRLNGPVNGLS